MPLPPLRFPVPLHPNHYTPRRAWQRLSDAEWAALKPYVAARSTAGRKLSDERARIEAFFWIAASGRPWKDLPEQFGKPDTVSRHFRRLAHAGLWELLLRALGQPATRDALAPLEPWIVRAFRRATRIMGGIKALLLARRLGFLSALRGPPPLLPDPDLSDYYILLGAHLMEPFRHRPWAFPRDRLKHLGKLIDLCRGRARPPLWRAA